MANNMIKFYRGLVGSLPETGADGAIYITTDEGGIYLGTGTGMKRLGDFVQVANVAALPAKAHENCLYYCVAENILAKWNGTEWKQVNKQPTTEELKELLGLGTLAYKSEVAEDDLDDALATKINDAAGAQHTHANAEELAKVADGDVAKWNAAEKNAKDYADELHTAMNTRVEALEAVDHEHENKALLDTYTQTEANLADAVAKKHAHTFNETELNKIVEGDVAKWNAVAADYLDSEDETALKALIKEAKQAGTDANTNIETYKVTNDARVLAVEEDVAEIVDGANGILAQAKTYSDNKLSAARTEITAEIDEDVKVVADELAGYKASNDEAIAGVKATAEAAATKEYTDAELAKKVDNESYEADKVTFATKTELGEVDAKFENYRTSADQDVIDNGHKERIEALEAKFTGDGSVDDKIAAAVKAEEDARKEAVQGVQGEVDGLKERMGTVEGKISDLEQEAGTHALKSDVEAIEAKLDDYVTTEDYEVDKAATESALTARYTKEEADNKFATKGEDAYDDTEVRGLIADNTAAIAAEAERAAGVESGLRTDVDDIKKDYLKAADKNEMVEFVGEEIARATGIEEGLRTDVDAIKADYLKAADKTELEGKVTAETERAMEVEGGLRSDVDVIKGDYLKAADKTELEGKITAEETRAKEVEESLQTQINTIMNNPDTEGVINSINEFTTYITEHGEIAEGFRTDIDTNAEAIKEHATAIEENATAIENILTGLDEFSAHIEETYATKETTDELEKSISELSDGMAFEVFDPEGHVAITYATKEEVATAVTELEDKYFVGGGEASNEIVFDHATTPYNTQISVSAGYWPYSFVKISDIALTEEDLAGAEIHFCDLEGWTSPRYADNGRFTESNGAKILLFGDGSGDTEFPVVILPTAEAAANYGAEVGTYVICREMGTNENGETVYFHVGKIVLANPVGEGGGKKLDEQYLPETVARVADVDAIDARVQELEAIDHEAYVAADEALREELVAEIEAAKTDAANKDVVVLAEAQAYADQAEADAIAAAKAETEAQVQALVEDGQVAMNAEAIANLIDQMSWGSF